MRMVLAQGAEQMWAPLERAPSGPPTHLFCIHHCHPVHPTLRLSVCPSILCARLSSLLSSYPPSPLSIHLSIHLCICSSFPISVCPSSCQFIYLSIHSPSIQRSVHLSVYPIHNKPSTPHPFTGTHLYFPAYTHTSSLLSIHASIHSSFNRL